MTHTHKNPALLFKVQWTDSSSLFRTSSVYGGIPTETGSEERIPRRIFYLYAVVGCCVFFVKGRPMSKGATGSSLSLSPSLYGLF